MTHGLPLSLGERELAAARILLLYPDWSNRAVARVSGLSDKTVASIRCSTADAPQLNTRGLDGRIRPRDASAARRQASEMIATNPEASLRSVAKEVGLAPATVRDVKEKMRRGEDPVLPRQRTRENTENAMVRRQNSIPQDWDRHQAFTNLSNDPSVRLTDAGKHLLRVLELHIAHPGSLLKLVDQVPSHCIETLSLMARDCSNRWSAFADSLASTDLPGRDKARQSRSGE